MIITMVVVVVVMSLLAEIQCSVKLLIRKHLAARKAIWLHQVHVYKLMNAMLV